MFLFPSTLLLASDLSFLHLPEPSLPSRRPSRHLGACHLESVDVRGSADTHVVPQVVLAARPRPRGASADHLDVMPTARTILAATQRQTAAGDGQKKKKARSSSRAVKRDSIRKRAQSLTRADGEEHTTTTTSEAGGSPAVDDGASPSAGGHQASRRRRRLPKVPELALRGLIEMGFTAGRARKVPHLLCASMPCLASTLAHSMREWCRPCC